MKFALKRKSLSAFFVLFLLSPSFASASTISELIAEIESLKQRIALLQSASGTEFSVNLYFGLSNNGDVGRLQEFLIENRYLSIAVPTGNFYSLTLQAVKNYQSAVGLPSTGYFGPLTRAKVNEALNLKKDIASIVEQIKVVETPKVAPAPDSAISSDNYKINPKPAYSLPNIIQNIHNLVNTERANSGLNSVAPDAFVAETARKHSADQSVDNLALTNPDIACAYPIIRHEGIRGGYSLRDRLAEDGISYRFAGENIVMFSPARDLVYRYSAGDPPPPCPEVASFPLSEGTKEERLSLYQEVLTASLNAVNGLPKVNWVNRNWLGEEEIARKAVDLWMNSPGHRANILRPEFNYSGLGIAEANDYFIITHNFLGR